MRKFIRVNLSRAPALRPISFFDYCEVSFDMGFEVTYLFDRKCEDKYFDIMGLGPEAVVFKRKWTALLPRNARSSAVLKFTETHWLSI